MDVQANPSQMDLDSIQRWIAAQRAAGKKVNPWEYEKLVEAAYTAANKNAAAMREAGAREKMLGLKERELAQNKEYNTARYGLREKEIAQIGSEGAADREFKRTMALLNNDLATNLSALKHAGDMDLLNTSIAGKRSLYDLQSGYDDEMGLYNVLGKTAGFILPKLWA